MTRESLFVKTDLVPNGESRIGLSHSDTVTSVDLIPAFDGFGFELRSCCCGQSLQQAKTVGTAGKKPKACRACRQWKVCLGIGASVRTSE